MIRILNRYFPGRLLVMAFADVILIILAVWAAVSLHIGSVHFSLLIDPGLLSRALLVTGICQVCFYLNDLYELRSIKSQVDLLAQLLKAAGLASFILALIYWVSAGTQFDFGIGETAVLGVILIILIWRLLLRRVRAYGGAQRLLVVGSGPIAQALLRQLRARDDLSLKAVGLVTDDPGEDLRRFPGVPNLGSLGALGRILQQAKPDRIVVALQERRNQLPIETLLRTVVRGVHVETASDLYEKLAGRVPIEFILASGLIFSGSFHKSAALRFYKRFFDFVGALSGLILTSPLLALLAVAIKIDSPGPVFYRQPRVGLGERIFEIVKFRSMRTDAESETGTVWVQEADPRVTRVGRIIRKFHLDEFPQLLNVLWGEMSLLGPRPERPLFIEKLRSNIHFYDVRHAVRPGMTGWAQVSQPYPRTIEEAKTELEYDLFYVKNMSVFFDMLIVIRTIKSVFFGLGTLPSDEPRTQIHFIARTPALPATNAAFYEPIPAALAVDVEDYFQATAFRHAIRYDQWECMESRVERNTKRVLDLMSELNQRGTFFILGWIAERFPALVRAIQAAGHELGCHSYAHRLVYEQTPNEFRYDTLRARKAIEDASGVPVGAYRAPSFSITSRSLWALDILAELGFKVDCSIFPIHHDLYGFPTAPRQPFRIGVNGRSLLEFPLTTLRIGRWNIPVTGGGYLRQLPLDFQVRALKTLEVRRQAIQLYFHPWELDPDQPRIAASLLSRLRHYRNLDQTADRLRRLLPLFHFSTVSEIIRCDDCVSEEPFRLLAVPPFLLLVGDVDRGSTEYAARLIQ
jgi:sugar transferase (PEP-CTERM system associated)/polysaccharide deacetylase family protein (PEP-CTERM system associated)